MIYVLQMNCLLEQKTEFHSQDNLHVCIFDESANAAQKMKFLITDFFSKCDQIRRKLRICSDLLKKSVMENLIFCAVKLQDL